MQDLDWLIADELGDLEIVDKDCVQLPNGTVDVYVTTTDGKEHKINVDPKG